MVSQTVLTVALVHRVLSLVAAGQAVLSSGGRGQRRGEGSEKKDTGQTGAQWRACEDSWRRDTHTTANTSRQPASRGATSHADEGAVRRSAVHMTHLLAADLGAHQRLVVQLLHERHSETHESRTRDGRVSRMARKEVDADPEAQSVCS